MVFAGMRGKQTAWLGAKLAWITGKKNTLGDGLVKKVSPMLPTLCQATSWKGSSRVRSSCSRKEAEMSEGKWEMFEWGRSARVKMENCPWWMEHCQMKAGEKKSAMHWTLLLNQSVLQETHSVEYSGLIYPPKQQVVFYNQLSNWVTFARGTHLFLHSSLLSFFSSSCLDTYPQNHHLEWFTSRFEWSNTFMNWTFVHRNHKKRGNKCTVVHLK